MAPLFTGLAKNLGGYGFGRRSAGATGFSASGGTKTTSGSWTFHAFTNTGPDSFVVTGSESRSIYYLVVAGGGSGGGSGTPSGGSGGGGGAGGAGSPSKVDSNGGPGLAVTWDASTPLSRTYAGGGGARVDGTNPIGGPGGGGIGSNGTNPGGTGVTNTGGGGGSAGYPNGNAGAGGPGIVVISYLT